MTFHVPEKYRVRTGPMRSDASYGNNGQFVVHTLKFRDALFVQASDKLGWEHISVSVYNRCPTWEEMCFIKDMFWDDGDLVVQLHPIKSQYVNEHPYVLHMWRKANSNYFVELPPLFMV